MKQEERIRETLRRVMKNSGMSDTEAEKMTNEVIQEMKNVEQRRTSLADGA